MRSRIGGDVEAYHDRLGRGRQHDIVLTDISGFGVEDVNFDISLAHLIQRGDDRL